MSQPPDVLQGKLTVTVGTLVGQPHEFVKSLSRMHSGMAQVEQMVPVLVTVGQTTEVRVVEVAARMIGPPGLMSEMGISTVEDCAAAKLYHSHVREGLAFRSCKFEVFLHVDILVGLTHAARDIAARKRIIGLWRFR